MRVAGRFGVLFGVLLALAAMMAAGGCGGGGAKAVAKDRAPAKLLVIGLDSADFKLLDPLMAEGRLPHLKAFRAQAASGRMQSFYPLEKSPLLWASICTGVMPSVHGIDNFVKGDEEKPVTGSAWRAPAIWDIIGAAGRTTYVGGMWVTYPARPINGVMVSDYLPYGSGRERPLAGLVSPDSLTARVVACRVDPQSFTPAQLARFFPAGVDVAALEQKYPAEFQKLRDIWAADLGYLAVARALKDQHSADLFFFYLRGPDMISHGFYHYLAIPAAEWRRDPAEREAFAQIVPRYYEWVDEAVGEVLSWFPADYPAVVVSDHGFHGPRNEGRGTAEHAEYGIFMVRSPLYAPGGVFTHLKLMDICPTLLAVLDLPPAKDMPGAVLAEALTPAGQKRVPHIEKNRVTSYLALRPAAGSAQGEADEAVNEEIRKQLRSLGYIK